jgi:hypothetical protein
VATAAEFEDAVEHPPFPSSLTLDCNPTPSSFEEGKLAQNPKLEEIGGERRELQEAPRFVIYDTCALG